jgi:hypothetical protein
MTPDAPNEATSGESSIEVFVETEADASAKTVVVLPQNTIEEVIRMIVADRADSFIIVVEEEEAPKERHRRLDECNIHHHTRIHCHPKLIHYKVDNEPQETLHHKLTPTEIMIKAEFDPADHYLVRLIGKHEQESYKNKSEVLIHLHNGMRFIVAACGPTPVS